MVLGLLAVGAGILLGGISYKQARDAQKQAKKAADAMAGVLVNKESNIEPIPVIYGERRVGGTRVYIKTAGGKKNEFLYVALVLCEGEVESITNIELDDTPITDEKFSGLYSVQTFVGTDDQTASTMLTATGNEWTTDHRLRGVAYIALRLKWDEDSFSGLPTITALVKGKKVYDPRTSTTAWSNNSALCIRDYLTNERYGKGLPASAIDDAAFSQAANDLDSFTATPYSGAPGAINIFETNIVLDTGDELFRNVEKMLLGCRGFLPYSQGQYSLKIDQATSSLMTLDTSTIIGGIQISGSKKEDRFNRVVVKFPNPETDWQPDQAVWPDAESTEETTYLAEDGGTLLVDEVDLDGVTNYYSARDIARILVLRSRNGLKVALQATSEAIDLTIGDVVSITHPTPGWTAKPFQVEEISLNYDGTVALSLIEYDSAIYAYDPANEETVYPDSDLPDPFAVEPPTNLSVVEATTLALDGTVLPALYATWDAANDAFVSQYELLINNDTDDTSTSDSTGNLDYLIAPVYANKTYTVGVRSINTLGVRSEYVSVTITATGDVTPPAVPTGLVANGGYKQISLAWVSPLDGDFKHVEIQRKNTAGGTWSTIGYSAGGSYVDYISTFGTVRYYRIRAVDFSNNASAYTGQVSAETDFVDSDAFTEEVQNLFIQAGLYGIEPVSSLPASGEFEGQVKYQTSDNKLYRWTGSAWTAEVPAVDITGQLSTLQIANDAITNAKIAVDAIQGDVIAANAITETKISDGSISTGKLAANAVTAAKIAAGTITASEIATGTITATQIATDTITANKIAAGAITASELATNSVTATKILAGTITGDKITANTITGGLIAASGIITNTAQIENGLITNAKIANLAVDTAKITDLAISTLKIQDEAVTIPLGASDGGFGTAMTAGTWYPASSVGPVSWTSADDRPSKITVIGSANFIATGGSSTFRSLELRIVMATNYLFTTEFVTLATVAATAQESHSQTLAITSTSDPSTYTSPRYYRLEMRTIGGGTYKQIGGNGISLFGVKK